MGWLYILQNVQSEKFYIGSTKNLLRRIRQHNSGYTRTTRVLNTKTLVYWEDYHSIEEARLREKKLKSYKSRKYIEWLIQTRSCSSVG